MAALLGISLGNATRDFRPMLKDEVRTLDRELAAASGKSSDRETRAHIADARDLIKEMLSVKD